MIDENLPRKVLVAVGCLISGFMLAAWCLPLMEKKPRLANLKPGFSITFPTSTLRDPPGTHKLIGKQVRIVRNLSVSSDTCVIDHAPLLFQVQDQFVILSGGLEGLENFIIHTSLSDLKSPELVEFPNPLPHKTCRTHPKVTYGE